MGARAPRRLGRGVDEGVQAPDRGDQGDRAGQGLRHRPGRRRRSSSARRRSPTCCGRRRCCRARSTSRRSWTPRSSTSTRSRNEPDRAPLVPADDRRLAQRPEPRRRRRRARRGSTPSRPARADLAYLGQVARAAEQSGFEAALTPTSSWCPDPWLLTAALTQQTERLKFLVAFRPAFLSPALAAQMAATYQRMSGGRLLINIVVGGDDAEQRRYGDFLAKDDRYAQAGEFLAVLRGALGGEVVDFAGEHVPVEGAHVPEPAARAGDLLRRLLAGGDRGRGAARGRVPDVGRAARRRWRRSSRGCAPRRTRAGRELRFGIRLHVIARDTSEEAWAETDRLLAGLDPADIERAQAKLRASGSEGQQRMLALHGGRTDDARGLARAVGGRRPRARRRGHRARGQPRGGRGPHRGVPRARDRRVRALGLSASRGGVPVRRGRRAGAARRGLLGPRTDGAPAAGVTAAAA